MCGVPKSKYIMDGDDAANDGLPLGACPYTGRRGAWWIDGWLAAVERNAANAREKRIAEQESEDDERRKLRAIVDAARAEHEMRNSTLWIDRMARGEGCA